MYILSPFGGHSIHGFGVTSMISSSGNHISIQTAHITKNSPVQVYEVAFAHKAVGYISREKACSSTRSKSAGGSVKQ